jgi:chaperone modulatory protein CbpM
MTDVILKISMRELCQSQRISQELLVEVVDYGIATPVEGCRQDEWVFDYNAVHWLKKAIKLNKDLEIDWVAVAMVIKLLKQRETLERENQQLLQQLKRFV